MLALPALVLALAACSKPEPPRITPREAKLVSISATGIDVDVTLAAENPNGSDLDGRDVSATMAFDDGLEIGKTNVAKPLHLPAHETVDLHVPVSLKWKTLQSLLPYAMRETVPYTVKGDVQFDGVISVRVPFTIKGILTRADLAKLAMNSIPGLPGLK